MVKIPLFPEYGKVKLLMKILVGKKASVYQNMWNTIWVNTGTPQNPVNWKEPNIWIPDRLNGDEMKMALTIWNESKQLVNPRYVRGPKFLIDGYELLTSEGGTFNLTEKGVEFLSSNENDTIKHIDLEEGCVFLLYLVSINASGKRGTYYSEWKEHLLKNSNYKQQSVINDSLSRRLKNLTLRSLILKEGNQYTISEEGSKYLEQFDDYMSFSSLSEEAGLMKKIDAFNMHQKEGLLHQISTMDPFKFEHTIKELLLAMGYDDVEVTSPTNDKGVDVVGNIQKGISSVVDVIQVKRNTTSNVQRKILDALRGSLHRFNAFQGTIITTSDFAKGTKDAAFEAGAAPITLINGSKLIDLLVEYGIGVKKKKANFFILDLDYFSFDEISIDEEAME
jgi:restriction system protein